MTDRDYDTKAYEDGVRAGRQEMQVEIERLRGSIVLQEELIRHGERETERLKAEVETWVGHAKTAIWSDSEQCQMLEAENERLLAENFSLAAWQCEFTDGKTGLVASEGGSTYCAMAKENERLRAALTEIRDAGPMTVDDQRWRIARAALEGKQ